VSLKWFRSEVKPTQEVTVMCEDMEQEGGDMPNQSLKVKRSVSTREVKIANEELNMLYVERNIVSFALTHLYESEAEGKISEYQRNILVEKYSSIMKGIEKNIEKTRLIVDLYEFESTRAELLKNFYDKFGEIEIKVEDLRTQLGLSDKKEKSKPLKSKVQENSSPKPKSDSLPKQIELDEKPKKKDTEQKIEAIQEEILKVLEELQKMDTEA